MARKLRPRKGTTAQNNAYTGAVAEVTIDTTKKTLVVHDGATAGGNPIPTLDDVASAVANHAAAVNPHPTYLTAAEGDAAYEALGTAASVMIAHVGDSDPHVGYLLEAAAPLIYEVIPEGWQTPTLVNSWANVATYRATQYRRQGDAITLIINLDSGTNNTLFTLPAGFRPTASFGVAVAVHGDGAAPAFGHVLVDSAGVVTLEHPSPISGHSVHTVFTFYTS